MARQPDWNLHAILPSPVESKDDASGKVGAAWNNEDGSISIVLNLAVVLDERSIAVDGVRAGYRKEPDRIRTKNCLENPYAAPSDFNFERAREEVAKWPEWKQEHALTKHSEDVQIAHTPGVPASALPQPQGQPTMSSREIAELTGKNHFDVLRDIRRMLVGLYGYGGSSNFAETYTHPQNGQEYPEYRLPKDLTITLVSDYDVTMRHRIVTRWMELEAASTPRHRAALDEAAQARPDAEKPKGKVKGKAKGRG